MDQLTVALTEIIDSLNFPGKRSIVKPTVCTWYRLVGTTFHLNYFYSVLITMISLHQAIPLTSHRDCISWFNLKNVVQ